MKKKEDQINKIYKNRKIKFSDLENFSTQLENFTDGIDNKEYEEHLKYLLRDFLKKTFYNNNAINTKGNLDFVIHLENSNKSKLGVIIETKAPDSREMITKENLQVKSMYQILLYYLQERINNQNNDIKHLIITNFYEWYIFDASDFEKLFFDNKELQKEFKSWSNKEKTKHTTNLFYTEIAPKYIKETDDKIRYSHLKLQNVNTKIEENQKELVRLYKYFSPEFLLKKSYLNDSNTLNKQFYYELLYIIGLEEKHPNGKKIIIRIKKQDGSLIENTITTFELEERYQAIENIEKYGNNKPKQIENIALELVILWINRILFLKLLEAQLITYQNNNQDFKFLNISTIRDYNELNLLFFAILARKPENRKNLKEKFKNIPYLNSSLFEINEIERQALRISSLADRFKLPLFNKTVLKNEQQESLNILEYIFKFLDAYDFTSTAAEEVQKEKKNLINASVLGLIFEKINGYKEGSFFTPGYITMYICRKTIREAVLQKFKTLPKFKTLAKFGELKDKIENRKKANEIINSLKICDPAVGSGHFLVSALNEVIAIKSELDILQYKSGNRIKNYRAEVFNDELIITDNETDEIFDYNLSKKGNPIKEKQDLQEAIFHEKETVIENCIFGVDINKNSVNICRLRLWIELLKSSYYTKNSNYKEIETLPNIDINIKQGNSLVGKFALARGHAPLQKMRLVTQKYKEQIVIYKSTNDKITKQNAEKAINKIKKDFAKNVNPNDNDYQKLQNQRGKLWEMQSRSPALMTDEDRKNWTKNIDSLIKEVDKLDLEYQNKLKTLYLNAFEWRFEFPEVLERNGNFEGFDLIIGNPPYIEYKQLKKFSRYFKKNYKIYSGTADISVYFFELALNILKKEKLFSYITTNKFFRTEYGKNLRDLLTQNQLIQIVDFEQVHVFDEALVSSSVIVGKKMKPDANFGYSKFEKEKIDSKKLTNEIIKRKIFFNPKEINSRAWKFISPEKEKIINKIETTGKLIKDYKTIQIRRGVTTGYDKAFIIDTEKQKELIKKDPKNKEIIKPLLKGKDIKKYYSKYDDLWLIFTRRKLLDIDNFPILKQFLSEHKLELQPRSNNIDTGRKPGTYEWFEIQDNTAYHKLFNHQKIIWPLTADKWGFCLDNNKYFLTSGAFFLTSEEMPIKFILAILNSKLMKFYFSAIGVMTAGGAYTLKKTTIERFTLPKPDNIIINSIIKKVDEIIKIKEIDINNDISKFENEIDKIIYNIYGLTAEELEIVEE